MLVKLNEGLHANIHMCKRMVLMCIIHRELWRIGMYWFTVEGPGPRGRLGPLRQWKLQAGGHWILLL